MKITYGSKHELTCRCKGCKSYELKFWMIRTKVVDATKLHLPPCEWINYLIPCIRIGICINKHKYWINFMYNK